MNNPPRYDEVFAEGTKWLDIQDSESAFDKLENLIGKTIKAVNSYFIDDCIINCIITFTDDTSIEIAMER